MISRIWSILQGLFLAPPEGAWGTIAVAVEDGAVGAVAQAVEDGGAEETIFRTTNVLCNAVRIDHAATRLPRPSSTLLPSNSRRLRAFSYSALCRLVFQLLWPQ